MVKWEKQGKSINKVWYIQRMEYYLAVEEMKY